jgi:hypothetical protein
VASRGSRKVSFPSKRVSKTFACAIEELIQGGVRTRAPRHLRPRRSRRRPVGAPHRQRRVVYPRLLPSELPLWIAAGVLAIEIECSLLFTLAALRGARARAGALLNVDNYVPERIEYEPHRDIVAAGTERMIRAALRAVPALSAIAWPPRCAAEPPRPRAESSRPRAE